MSNLEKDELRDLYKLLGEKDPSKFDAVIGFDGFVDEVVHVVDKRLDPKNFTRVLTLKEYGRRIAATSGLSSNVEIVTISKKLGGNGPIFANALIEMGVSMSYVGAIGYPEVNPVFYDMAKQCKRVYPVSDPSSTDAVEFEDGKIIRSKLSPFQELNFQTLKERVGLEALAGLLDDCDIIGFENWALPPYSGQIWKGILNEVMPLLKNSTKGRTLFFDLADPASRQDEEILEVLKVISSYTAYYNVVLGLNLREAVQVANLFGRAFDFSDYNLKDIAEYIRKFVDVSTLVIHPVKKSCCLVGSKYYHRTGPYCEKPRLTTGAGDNFNAGFVLGISLGLKPGDALLLGMVASGFYVRQARSANYDELRQFVKAWAEDNID